MEKMCIFLFVKSPIMQEVVVGLGLFTVLGINTNTTGLFLAVLAREIRISSSGQNQLIGKSNLTTAF